jgi:hypothetical protein
MSDSNFVNTVQELKPTALVYPSFIEGQTQFSNVLLINRQVQEYQQFIDSANSSTFPIAYSVGSSKSELLELLRSNFTSIDRLGLIFHSSGENASIFLDEKPLFTDSEKDTYSENTQFILDIIKGFQVKNIDYLACDTLNYSTWVNYYNTLANETGVIVGASNNKTGNIKYGGDWVLESTSEDIELVYFNSSIEYYQFLLDTITIENVTYTYSTTGSVASAARKDSNITSAVIQNTITVSTKVYTVTSIGNYAFDFCRNLTSVSIPNSVSSIGSYAFYYCSKLMSVTIPNSLSSIGSNAFYYCSGLTSVTIPNSVTSIGIYAFYSCTNLTSVTIGDSVTSIGSYVFYYCSKLMSVTIGDSVTSIGEDAFGFCSSLTSVTIPDSVSSIGSIAFRVCSKLMSVTIPDSVSSIGEGAFNGCTSLTSVTIPNSVTSIGNSAFYYCSGLTSIIVDSTNNYYSSLYGVLFDKNALILIQYPIGNVQTIYTIPNSVTSIGDSAFESCSNLTSVTIPDSVSSIGRNAFRFCSNLTSVTIGDSVTSIGEYAFYSCSNLTSVTIPNSVTSIGIYAFYSCTNLTSVTIPNSVSSIREGAFDSCTNLTSIIIPNSVSSIGNYAFHSCSKLMSVTIPNSVTSIGSYAFESCSSLTSVIIGDSVTSIGIAAFNSCSKLMSVTIPNSVTSIGSFTFGACTNLTSVTIPNSVTSIGRYAFNSCSNLTSVTIPNSVTSIGDFAFDSCSKLTSVIFLSINSLPSFGNSVFPTSPKVNTAIVSNGSINTTTLTSYFTNILINPTISGLNDIECFFDSGPITLSPISTSSGSFTYVSLDDSIASISGSTITILKIGSVTINATLSAYGNYAEAIIVFTLDISPATPIISGLNDIVRAFDSGPITLSPISTSSGSFTYVSSDDSIASISGNNITILNVGSVTINATQQAYGNYAEASKVFTLFISSATPTISGLNDIECFFGSAPITLSPISTSSGSFTYVSSDDSIASISVSTITILKIGSVTITATLSAYGNYTEASKVFTLVIYDPTNPVYTDQDTGFLYGFNQSTTTASVKAPGYRVNITNINILSEFTTVHVKYTVTEIPGGAFRDCRNATVVSIPNTITSIQNSAFELCSKITDVSIPDSVTSLGTSVFQYCSNLTSVYLSSSITSIPNNTFYDCQKLTYLNIPNVKTIGEWAFYNCHLTNVIIPNSVTIIYGGAFNSCTNLTEIIMSNKLKIIDSNAFTDCSQLTEITIPNTVTRIGYADVFKGCTRLNKVTFLSLTSLPRFYGSIGFFQFTNVFPTNPKVNTVVLAKRSIYTDNKQAIDMYFQNVEYNYIQPTLSGFVFENQVLGTAPFLITPPGTDSPDNLGEFIYTSLDPTIVSISSDKKIIIHKVGSVTITATQQEYNNYLSATINATLTIEPSTLNNPTKITTNEALTYFLQNTTAGYGNVVNNIIVSNNKLVTNGVQKTLITKNKNGVKITKTV